MTPLGIERRIGQRFLYLLPLTLRIPSTAIEGVGFTQDLSSRGVFFFTDAPLAAGAEIELTLRMPSEITLGESMRVRCRGRILRVVKPGTQAAANAPTTPVGAETKIGVGVRFEHYEYLADAAASPRVVHARPEQELPLAHSSARS